jgi:hypothetical protein
MYLVKRKNYLDWSTKMKKLSIVLVLLILGFSTAASFANIVTLLAPASGDGTFAWNSKYGDWGYSQGGTEMGVGLSMGGSYGNDYTVSIFEIPIASLAGKPLTSAVLQVYSLGFGTGYYYGSAAIGWLDTGAMVLTGDFVADGLGAPAKGRPNSFYIFNTDWPGSEQPGYRQFDVLSYVQADLAAGRSFSTFVMSGSRDTGGSIYTAESGFGPSIIAVIPEPATIAILALGMFFTRTRRK